MNDINIIGYLEAMVPAPLKKTLIGNRSATERVENAP